MKKYLLDVVRYIPKPIHNQKFKWAAARHSGFSSHKNFQGV